MARAITVKVATVKVINALETKLATIKKDYAEQEANEAKYSKSLEKWKKEVLKFAIDNIKVAENVRSNYRSWSNMVNIDFDIPTTGKDFPEQPERDFTQMAQYEYKNAVEEISNALNILRMTDEEVVNASTMKSIAQYL